MLLGSQEKDKKSSKYLAEILYVGTVVPLAVCAVAFVALLVNPFVQAV